MASSLYLVFLVIATWTFVNGSLLYVTNDQGQWVPLKMDHRQEEELRQELRQEILNMLGLVKIPKFKFNQKMMQSALEFLKNLYKITDRTEYISDGIRSKISNSADVNTLDLNASRVERAEEIMAVINIAQKASFQRHRHDMTFYFEVSKGEQINAAELRIFKEASPVFRTGRFSVSFYAIKERMEKGFCTQNLDIMSTFEYFIKQGKSLGKTGDKLEEFATIQYAKALKSEEKKMKEQTEQKKIEAENIKLQMQVEEKRFQMEMEKQKRE